MSLRSSAIDALKAELDERGVVYNVDGNFSELSELLCLDNAEEVMRARVPQLNDDVISVIVSYLVEYGYVYRFRGSHFDFDELWRIAQISRGFRYHASRERGLVLEEDRRNRKLRHQVMFWCKNRSAAEAKYGHISDWDTSEVTSMRGLFFTESFDQHHILTDNATKNFNDDISRWDVGRVNDMRQMFYGAETFDQDLAGWNVARVADMTEMFREASSFDGNLSGWNVETCASMERMFSGASSFNGNLSGWNVESCEEMGAMFYRAEAFTGTGLSGWDVRNARWMGSMFFYAGSFDPEIVENWNISSVEDIEGEWDLFHSEEEDDDY
ncbi:hypothetical protein TL16_g06021 [Triparma laevis f. inornata]|uniref:BspA family leucine-rich repeat surface protein n=2 Tax=Triparma laevis TaxID=1534972 RepID=A0A9W7F5P1_9STRA|nr:hypothetical protein TL16_g06021 [Triparma laevis f. inornata]GMI04239.1 hypothetical protein TrLO_g7258 [Triparma laevis f. longispina]